MSDPGQTGTRRRVQQKITGGTHAKGSDRGRTRPSTMGFCPQCDGWFLRHRHEHDLYDKRQDTVDETGAPDDVPSLEAFVR